MKIRSGWKVTYYGKSVFAPLDAGGREYPTNVWVHPEKNYGPLAVFNRRQAAQKWVDLISFRPAGDKIRQCDYEPSPHQDMWRAGLPLTRMKLERAPQGTRLARAVRCLE